MDDPISPGPSRDDPRVTCKGLEVKLPGHSRGVQGTCRSKVRIHKRRYAMDEEKIKGKITMEKDYTRKVYFEGYDEPLVSLSNPDLSKIGLRMNTKVPHSFHIVAGVLGS